MSVKHEYILPTSESLVFSQHNLTAKSSVISLTALNKHIEGLLYSGHQQTCLKISYVEVLTTRHVKNNTVLCFCFIFSFFYVDADREWATHPCYGQIEVNCIIVATGQFTHQLIILTGRYNRYASCWSQCRAQDVKHENCIYFCVHTIFNIKYKYKIYSFLASPAKVVLGKLLLLQELMTRP